MQDELLRIRDLNRLDREQDADQATLTAMVEAVKATTAEITAARSHLEAAQAALARCQEEERTLSRRLSEYTRRRDDTRRLMETGQASDYAVAERQLSQVTGIVDELETQTLEAMDARESAAAALAAAERRLVDARAADTAARDHYRATSPGLKDAMAARTAQRAPLLKLLISDRRRQYEDLRQRGSEALAFIVGGCCDQCHRQIAPQISNEVRMGRQIHNCRGCGRFFFDVRDPQEEDDGEDGDDLS